MSSVWMLLPALGLAASPANSVSTIGDSSFGRTTVLSPNESAWRDYATFLISHQLCNVRDTNDCWCPSPIMKSATGQVSGVPDHYFLHAFKVFSGQKSSLPVRAPIHSGLKELAKPTHSRMQGLYIESLSRVKSVWLALRLNSLRDAPSLTAKQVIPGSLLNTILALIGLVAVARRDTSGKNHASGKRVYCCDGQARRRKRHLFAAQRRLAYRCRSCA
jgi:hypothetical protein